MLSVTWYGRRAFERRMHRAAKNYRKELRKQFRKAANSVRRAVRREIRSTLRGGEGYAARHTKVKVRVSRNRAWAVVYPSGKSRAYMGIHEYGGKIQRKGRRLKTQIQRSGDRAGRVRVSRGKPNVATYREQPTYRPAVRKSSDEVFRILGRSFRVV